MNNDLLDAVRAKSVAWLLVRLDLDADPLYTVSEPDNAILECDKLGLLSR